MSRAFIALAAIIVPLTQHLSGLDARMASMTKGNILWIIHANGSVEHRAPAGAVMPPHVASDMRNLVSSSQKNNKDGKQKLTWRGVVDRRDASKTDYSKVLALWLSANHAADADVTTRVNPIFVRTGAPKYGNALLLSLKRQ